MEESFSSRTELLLTSEGVARLRASHVALFGLGGVGGACAEALVRAGVGELTLVDMDRICESNLNRQILTLRSNIGKLKCDAASERLLDINPDLKLHCHPVFYGKENADQFDFGHFDYIADAIDNVTGKLLLAERATSFDKPIISCMGTGNKLDPTRLRVSDIAKTSVCPLARVMRIELRKRGISHLRVVWSDELPIKVDAPHPASVSFVPPVAGYQMAREIILTLCKGDKTADIANNETTM